MSEASARTAAMTNGGSIALSEIPTLDAEAFGAVVVEAVAQGQRVAALFATAGRDGRTVQLYVVLACDAENRLGVARMQADGDRFPSLTPQCPQVHLFEREIAEQFGLRAEGHPWLKPLRFHRSWTDRDAWGRAAYEAIAPGVVDFYRVDGDEVHEVAVGPVHAGVIEPGHFRFQCHGEQVFHLEIVLGYQHRGVEQAMVGGPHRRSIHYAETLAGDTTIAHATAYCRVVEALAGCRETARSQTLRGVALELERLANHVGDLGALANDVAFLPTASYCGRIRGDFLNMTALLCGNRFGRGMVRPGGVGFDVDDSRVAELLRRLDEAYGDTAAAVQLLWDTPSVMARLEDIGPLPKQVAVDLGMVGPAARASGLVRDVRHDQPSGIFRSAGVPVCCHDGGDVFARAYIRWLEIRQSTDFVRQHMRATGAGAVRVPVGPLSGGRLVAALEEGWRGEVCHVAITDAEGRFERYKIVDPSFHNWSGLGVALRGQQISDFPVCNKSFNLSYCGHDL